MKILHTIYDDVDNPWCGGGGAVRALEINRRMAQRHEITLLTGNYPGASLQEVREGIHIHRIGTNRSYALSRLSYSLLLPRYLRRRTFDLWVYDFSAFAPVHAPPSLRARAVLVLHHLMGGHALRKYFGVGLLAWAAEAVNTRLYPRIITVSPGTASQVKSRVGPNVGITTIYNGVDASCFIPDIPDLPAPRPSRQAGANYILYFGRLDIYNKGIDLLLKAFAQIGGDYPDVRLILAGRGTQQRQRELESLCAALNIRDRVEVTGPVSEARKRELFGGALFTCLPSRYEGWGITAIEAGAAGKAVIGADIPGLADAIRKDETGLLVAPENVDALAGAMQHLLGDPEARRRFGQAGREWAGRFTWDRIALQQERAYEQAIRKISKKQRREWD